MALWWIAIYKFTALADSAHRKYHSLRGLLRLLSYGFRSPAFSNSSTFGWFFGSFFIGFPDLCGCSRADTRFVVEFSFNGLCLIILSSSRRLLSWQVSVSLRMFPVALRALLSRSRDLCDDIVVLLRHSDISVARLSRGAYRSVIQGWVRIYLNSGLPRAQ